MSSSICKLKPFHLAIIQLQEISFFFMYPFPIAWDKPYTKISLAKFTYKKFTYKLIPWFLTMLLMVAGIFVTTSTIIILIYFPPPDYRLPWQKDTFLASWIMICISSMAVVCHIMLFMCVAMDMDCYYHIIEYFLPDPMYRDTSTIFYSILLRLALIAPVNAEVCRTISVGCYATMVVYEDAVLILQILETRVNTINSAISIQNLLVLHRQLARRTLDTAVWLGLSGCFWTLVIFIWLAIRGRYNLPSSMYGVVIVVNIGLLSFYTMFLPKVVQVCMSVEDTEERNRRRSYELYYCCKRRSAKIKMMQAKAILPIRIWYGRYWVINRDFLMEHLDLIANRVFDALCIS
ncbi:unnamed protein product [Orchesella dallaii]|uniref:Gustatory receptor n=1 Tax=Orchesella dallaii TaxID=48710 RepID=A0ABP1QIJ4_9HEXA